MTTRRKPPRTLQGTAAPARASHTTMHVSSAPRRRAADIAERRRDVARWLARAVTSGLIVSRLMQKYRVSRRTAEGDLAMVREKWIARIEAEEPQRRAKLLGHLDEILMHAIADREWNAATRAAATLANVCGFNRTNVSIELSPVQRAHVDALRLGDSSRSPQQARAVVGALALTPSQRAQRRRELLGAGDGEHEQAQPKLSQDTPVDP
jgi:hypothetical protein